MKQPPASIQLDLKTLFSFELDEFQHQAIAALTAGKSVVVCAPTGSGKTVIGEYAIYHALRLGKRVFYTTPLKALSNQKFRDFQEKFAHLTTKANPEELIGLITGDTVINPDAPIVIMTTEIFRNMLYETPIGQVGTSLEDVATVVLDECHYISDRGRGTVWEESIIYCPPSIQLVALSATIGNPQELTDWIELVRLNRASQFHSPTTVTTCELINSNFRPVPLHYYFSTIEGLFPLLNEQQTALNSRLKSKRAAQKRKRLRREDCPKLLTVVQQLQEKDLLPAIYVIFSRRGCELAVGQLEELTLVTPAEAKALQYHLLCFFLADNPSLATALTKVLKSENPPMSDLLMDFLLNSSPGAQLLAYLATDEDSKCHLFYLLAECSQLVKYEQVEPLTRGIASHHAGILPLWKELVEQLFEIGLVKVIFATATLAAGINMPARTTVISALAKRTDEGHSMLTPSEFLQIAGRAGRRGMDAAGHVVTVQTPFEGATEAAYLATADPEPLRSCFTPSYGMVLNLLQKHTLEEAKDLLERSFAEYLAQLKLEPERQAIASLTTELARLDVELAGITEQQLLRYEKLKATFKEEQRLLKILQQQAEESRRAEIAPLLTQLPPGAIVHLKGKYLKVATPLLGLVVAVIAGSGQAPDYLCLAEDNYWYRVKIADIADINLASVPHQAFKALNLTDLSALAPGQRHKGDSQSTSLCRVLLDSAVPPQIAPEILEQQQRCDRTQAALDSHPLLQRKNPTRLLKLHQQRLTVRENLHASQIKYQKLQSRQPYYWQEFLNLIEILREFEALLGYNPTPLGEAAAVIRGENELWLGLVMASGCLDSLAPHQLAAAISATITETLRPDTWTNYTPSAEVMAVFNVSGTSGVSLREVRRQLYQTQSRYQIAIPVWLELELVGLVEQWALGEDWQVLAENTSLDEGDIVRLLRRTIDLLWQIPQIPGINNDSKQSAKAAVASLKRFPI